MAVAIMTMLSMNQVYRLKKEQETVPEYSQIQILDPEGIVPVTSDDYLKKVTLQGNELTDEVLSLHKTLSNIIGLLTNSDQFAAKVGPNQLINIHDYEPAKTHLNLSGMKIDTVKDWTAQTLPQLFLFHSSPQEFPGLPEITAELFPSPEWGQGQDVIYLREKERGERMRPAFHIFTSFPQGVGFLNSEAWGLLLTYEPAQEFAISAEAITLVDAYAQLVDMTTGNLIP